MEEDATMIMHKVVPLELGRFIIYSYLTYTEHISGTSLYCQKIPAKF